MDLVQQRGQPLDFIDHHPSSGFQCLHFKREKTGVGQQPLVFFLGEKVEYIGFGKFGSQPSALSGAAWAHQKETLLGRG
jgi:hypothetical protein